MMKLCHEFTLLLLNRQTEISLDLLLELIQSLSFLLHFVAQAINSLSRLLFAECTAFLNCPPELWNWDPLGALSEDESMT